VTPPLTHPAPDVPPDPEAPPPAPIPVLPLEYAPPTDATTRSRTWRRIARVCLAAAWPACVVAVAAIHYKTESVIGTGPVLFTLGLLTLLGGLFTRDRPVAGVGACHCGICLLFFGLVNLLEWSPDEARNPFLVMGTVYTFAVAFPTGFALFRPRADYR
jgi:hypothetical protein